MRTLLNRLRAAWRAFKDPRLVGDGVWLRDTLRDMYQRDRMALLRAVPEGDDIGPQVNYLPLGFDVYQC